MGKPFDRGLTTSMEDTTRDLMEAFGANIGYTQSDEITLIWGNPFPIRGDDSTLIFSGKLQKLCSNLASYCTLSFFTRIVEYHSEALEEKPTFDCRLWQVPSMEVALSNIDWRRRDAIKNSISMAATCYFSHNSLLGVGSKKRKQMLADKGIIWEEYPGYFKEGTLLLKQEIKSELSEEEKERIPEPFREVADTLTRKVYRSISFKELIETLSVV
jgi:tRNA(His) 5'-end guanylyltransferase